MRTRNFTEAFLAALSLAAAAAVLGPVVLAEFPWPTTMRDLLSARGSAETGATNLVSAIYLGYRAYDTIGETIVLLVALAGSITLMPARKPAPESRTEKPRRTELIDTVSGKLAPVVLLFGCYVMLYGHVSPGGGFQGGVVLASGVIFIALGRREGGLGSIDPRRAVFGKQTLSAVEAAAFALILVLASLGLAFGTGLTSNSLGSLFPLPRVSYIVALNVAIGLKVGSGVALLCVVMLGGEER